MDPTATLARIRELQGRASSARTHEEAADLYGELSLAFEDLDAWMTNGGMPPEQWRKAKSNRGTAFALRQEEEEERQ